MTIPTLKIKTSLTIKNPTRFFKKPTSALVQNLLLNLWNDGIITGFTLLDRNKMKKIKIFVKRGPKNIDMKSLVSASRSSSAFNASLRLLWVTKNNADLAVISTSAGVLPLEKCRKYRLGGKLLVSAR